MDSHIVYGIVIAAGIILFLVIIGIIARNRERYRRIPENPYIMALKMLIAQDSEAAYKYLQQTVKSGSAPMDAYLRLGKLLRERGEAAKALQLHQSLTVKTNLEKGEKTDLFLNISEDYAKLGKRDSAIRVLERAVNQMGLREPQIYTALAKHYNAQDNTEQAYENLKELKRTRSLTDKHLALFLTSRAEKLALNGNEKEASRLIQRALKHDSGCAPAHLLFGDLKMVNGEVEGALSSWKRAAMQSPELSGKALASLEKTLFDKGKFGDIERIYNDILQARERDETVTLSLASFYIKQGKIEETIQLLKEFLAEHPESISGSKLLLSVYAKQGDLGAVEEVVNDLLAHAVPKKIYLCNVCRSESDIMRWHCPSCNSFDSYIARNDT